MELNYHKSLDILHQGCEKQRAYFIPYQSEFLASRGNRAESERFVSLCGEWDFHYYTHVPETDAFTQEGAVTEWEKMTVPMSWQLALDRDYDRPHYHAINYSFPLDPPHVSYYNPCALYRREVEVTEPDLKDFQINLVFEGADSCFYLFVNNQFAAYTQGSHSMTEVAIDRYLVAGTNEIKVLVIKWCDGTYLEDQDKIRLSGIFREVYLLKRDPVRIEDFYVRTALNDDLSVATLTVEMEMNGDASVPYKLLTPDGQTVATGCIDVENGRGDLAITLQSPMLWSDETPNLYELYFFSGNEVIRQEIGVRRFEVKGKYLYVNNKLVKGKGINRHDSHPNLGAATPLEHMIRDLYILKQHNFNMVRTSHYPNEPRFMELCNRLGFYVCDEADLETHGMDWANGSHHPTLATYPEWREAFMDRAICLFERDKNFSCVLMWSLGNETAIGENHRPMADYIHTRMPGSIVHNERYNYFKSMLKAQNPLVRTLKYEDFKELLDDYYVDVDSRMYISPQECIDEYLENPEAERPLFLCEYCHAMGNGPGDLKPYWDLIWTHDDFFGACVWEMTDHSVDIGTPEHPKFVYGGDLDPFLHGANCCIDGMVYPDRRVHTGMLEHKQLLRPVIATAFDEKRQVITLRNRKYFTDLSDVELCWTIESNGKVVRRGKVALNTQPQTEEEIGLSLGDLSSLRGYCYLNVSYRTKYDLPWAEAGYEVGIEQFPLQAAQNVTLAPKREGEFSLTKCGHDLLIRDGHTVYTVSEVEGTVTSIRDHGKELLTTPIEFNLWRAPTDNDRTPALEWVEQGYDRLISMCHGCQVVEENENCISVKVRLHIGAVTRHMLIHADVFYTVNRGEGITLRYDVNVDQTYYNPVTLPRLGIQFQMPKGTEQLRYFGMGPMETYQDKCLAARMGLFESRVADHFEHYVKPQENMAHLGTKWAKIYSVAGHGLLITGADNTPDFSFNCSHYTPMQLTQTRHDYELEPMAETVVNVDFKQCGVGSNYCGPKLADEYCIYSGDYHYSFRLLPIFANDVDPFAVKPR
ncbi:MAG: DUF4981 domain-containing protein [Clostridia bacterium]|nr:DUF4981 domain-containing protein [Clostridia bacterium]